VSSFKYQRQLKMKEFLRRVLGCVVACMMLVAIGCGDAGPDLGTPVDISGKVTLDGQPLSDVTLNFYNAGEGVPAEHRAFQGKTGPDGAYTIEGVYPATYQVSVQQGSAGDAAEGEDVIAEDVGPMARYQSGSELSATVSETQTRFDFELTSRR
jgi:hypothetical protein